LSAPIPAIDLRDDLSIGTVAPSGAVTNPASGFWQGPAYYNFAGAGYTTPYLTSEQQLDNWNYILYGTARIEQNGVAQPITAEIQALTSAQCAVIEGIGQAQQIIQLVPQSATDPTVTIAQNATLATVIITSPGATPVVMNIAPNQTTTISPTPTSTTPLTTSEATNTTQALEVTQAGIAQLDGIFQAAGIPTGGFFTDLSDAISLAQGDPSAIFNLIGDVAGETIEGFVSFLTGGWIVLPLLPSINSAQVQTSQGSFTIVVYPGN
jgi:hypothetical protein